MPAGGSDPTCKLNLRDIGNSVTGSAAAPAGADPLKVCTWVAGHEAMDATSSHRCDAPRSGASFVSLRECPFVSEAAPCLACTAGEVAVARRRLISVPPLHDQPPQTVTADDPAQKLDDRAAGGRGAPATLDRCRDGDEIEESGLARSSRDFPSAATPRKMSITPPMIITAAPMR
jgi:hypothetical protein